MENLNLEKWIIITSNKSFTIEEEKEIRDVARKVLRRTDKNRKVFVVESIDFVAKEI